MTSFKYQSHGIQPSEKVAGLASLGLPSESVDQPNLTMYCILLDFI